MSISTGGDTLTYLLVLGYYHFHNNQVYASIQTIWNWSAVLNVGGHHVTLNHVHHVLFLIVVKNCSILYRYELGVPTDYNLYRYNLQYILCTDKICSTQSVSIKLAVHTAHCAAQSVLIKFRNKLSYRLIIVFFSANLPNIIFFSVPPMILFLTVKF